MSGVGGMKRMRSLDVDNCGGDDDEGDSEALIGMLMSVI